MKSIHWLVIASMGTLVGIACGPTPATDDEGTGGTDSGGSASGGRKTGGSGPTGGKGSGGGNSGGSDTGGTGALGGMGGMPMGGFAGSMGGEGNVLAEACAARCETTVQLDCPGWTDPAVCEADCMARNDNYYGTCAAEYLANVQCEADDVLAGFDCFDEIPVPEYIFVVQSAQSACQATLDAWALCGQQQ